MNTIGKKHACKFVLGYYLFLKAHSFPWALPLENCGTGKVSGLISMHMFATNRGYCLLILCIDLHDVRYLSSLMQFASKRQTHVFSVFGLNNSNVKPKVKSCLPLETPFERKPFMTIFGYWRLSLSIDQIKSHVILFLALI